ncbi:MAG: hypothetical protein L6406_14730 [Desulfobacterales bacterium]|nr:hypothetical protein [Desulfobacterales bacterium]
MEKGEKAMEQRTYDWGDPIEAARKAWEGVDIPDILLDQDKDETEVILTDIFCDLILNKKIPDDWKEDCKEWEERNGEEADDSMEVWFHEVGLDGWVERSKKEFMKVVIERCNEKIKTYKEEIKANKKH